MLTQGVDDGRVDPERDPLVEPVVDDARDLVPIAADAGLALDHGGDDQSLVWREAEVLRLGGEVQLLHLLLHLRHQPLRDVHLGVLLDHLIGRGEQQPLERLDVVRLVLRVHLAVLDDREELPFRQVRVVAEPYREVGQPGALRERDGDELGAQRTALDQRRQGVARRQPRGDLVAPRLDVFDAVLEVRGQTEAESRPDNAVLLEQVADRLGPGPPRDPERHRRPRLALPVEADRAEIEIATHHGCAQQQEENEQNDQRPAATPRTHRLESR